MKKITFLLTLILLATAVWAQDKHLSALFGYSSFYSPSTKQAYVETYLDFSAWSLNFVKDEEGSFRATVEITLVVRHNDTIAYLKKYDLLSPRTNAEDATNFTFSDLRRFSLQNGIYDLQMILHDKASNDDPFVYNDKLVVYYPTDKPSMSNIQLMSSAQPTSVENMLSRNGYDMVPYISDFIPASITQLHPYFEFYYLQQELGNKPYDIVLNIEKKETGYQLPAFSQVIRRPAAKAFDAYYATMDISQLPSGNYNLVAEARDENGNTLVKKSIFFFRSNPNLINNDLSEDVVATSFASLIKDKEKLNYYIRALYPICGPEELTISYDVMNDTSLVAKQTFFYYFWETRSPLTPNDEWLKYKARLDFVDAHYSYPMTPGYMTDRGRVYLQYGPPDFVRDEKNFVGAFSLLSATPGVNSEMNGITPDQTSYDGQKSFSDGLGTIHYLPYQLWRYNKLPDDYNYRVFLFWDQMRGGNYRLLNSNARGEVQTAGWERMLSQQQLPEGMIGEVGEQFERGY